MTDGAQPEGVVWNLEELFDFAHMVGWNTGLLDDGDPRFRSYTRVFRVGDLYCSSCGGARKMFVEHYYSSPGVVGDVKDLWFGEGNPEEVTREDHDDLETLLPAIANALTDSLFSLQCVHCNAHARALIYHGPLGPDMVMVRSSLGGLSTPHTPPSVAYYLDQAQRAHSSGARSAAIAMYRGALDSLLYEQGFRDRMAGEKLRSLKARISDRTAPTWALELDPDFIDVIIKLGNSSIHPGDGDIQSQAEFDSNLLALMSETFAMLLTSVYEEAHRKQSLLSGLKTKLNRVKGM